MLKDEMHELLSKITAEWKAARYTAFKERLAIMFPDLENPEILQAGKAFVFYLDNNHRLKEHIGYTTWVNYQVRVLGVFWVTVEETIRSAKDLAKLYH